MLHRTRTYAFVLYHAHDAFRVLFARKETGWGNYARTMAGIGLVASFPFGYDTPGNIEHALRTSHFMFHVKHDTKEEPNTSTLSSLIRVLHLAMGGYREKSLFYSFGSPSSFELGKADFGTWITSERERMSNRKPREGSPYQDAKDDLHEKLNDMERVYRDYIDSNRETCT